MANNPGPANSPAAPTGGERAFRLAPPTVDSESVRDLAHRFGLAGSLDVGARYEDARLTTYAERPWELTVHRASGALRFHDTTRWQVDDGSADVDFDDDTAIGIARGHLEQYALAPLGECQLLRVTRLRVGVAQPSTGFAQERVIDVGVAFQRLIDGVPVIGPGGRVIVYIDHAGALTGVDRIWRDLGGATAEGGELRPPESAYDEARDRWSGPAYGRVAIGEPRLGYLELGWDDVQAYLQPVYYLPVTITATEGRFAGEEIMRSEHFATALADPPGPLLPTPPETAAPATRRGYEPSEGGNA